MPDNQKNNINVNIMENSDGSYSLQINKTLSKEDLDSLNKRFYYIDECEKEYDDVDPYDDEGNAMAASDLASANADILSALDISELASDISKICDRDLIDTILDIMKKDGTYKEGFDNLSLKELLEVAEEFDWDQVNQIWYGIYSGLTQEQIAFYAKPEFNAFQMSEIRWGFEEDFSVEQISLYTNPEFGNRQIEQIESGLENGLSVEQISLYAKPEFSWEQMARIEQGFVNGLSMEQVKVYANPEFSPELMDNFREALEKEYLKDNSLDSMINEAREECKAENVNITAQRDTQKKTAPGDDGAI